MKSTVASGFKRAPREDEILQEDVLAISVVSRFVLDVL